MNEGLILQELKEIKEQLQSINDALKCKKIYHEDSVRGKFIDDGSRKKIKCSH